MKEQNTQNPVASFEALGDAKYRELLKFPVYITLLAANSDGKLDAAEQEEAIHFSHIKTYSSDPLLADYFKEADNVFQENVKQVVFTLPEDAQQREAILKNKLASLEHLITRLEPEYAEALRRSMKSFSEHVSKAHHNILQDFVFPFVLK